MSFVIVTSNQYILASKIHQVSLNETHEYVELHQGYDRKSVKEFTYNITVHYITDTLQQQGFSGQARGEELRECVVSIRGKVNAHKAYRELIQQIREQMPDQLYLDKALERLLGQSFDTIADTEANEKKEAMDLLRAVKYKLRSRNDGRAKKASGAGKAKRASKKVLRRAKKRR